MRVLLVRHAEAIDPRDAPNDEVRWLTPSGRATARQIAPHLVDRGLKIERFLTSPLVRAVQTAELLAVGSGFDGEIEASKTLAGGSAQSIVALLNGMSIVGDVVLVGHEPTIRDWARELAPEQAFMPFPTAGMAFIDFRARTLLWRLDPEQPDD